MRRRLVIVAAAISSMVAIAFLVPLIVLVHTIARDRAISDAERDGAALAPFISVSLDRDSIAVAAANTASGRDGRMTVVLPSGDQIGRPIVRDDELALALRGTSFSAAHDDGTVVYTSVLTDAGSSAIRVFVPNSTLRKGVTGATWSLIALGTVLVLGAVAVSDRLGASMVRPVRRLADAADRLGEGDLEQRVEPEGPREVAAVAQAFNLLAGRVGELLAAERELVADLSHRLRTPLTVLRFETDAVTDPETRARVRAAAGELETAVTALIEEARRPISSDVRVGDDLTDVVRARVDFWRALADDQGRTLEADIANGPVVVPVARHDLEAAVDALLGNVFEHTPDGTPFAVSLREAEGGVELTISDAGSGFDDAALERGRSGGGSTGLGLDIARRTVESAGGTFAVTRSELGGASISLTFPSSRR